MAKNVKRLFASFRPEHYDIQLAIADDKLSFSGTLRLIGMKTGRPSKRITLHQKNLEISNVVVKHTDKKNKATQIRSSRLVKHNTFEEIRIHADGTLYPGKYEITLNFSGKITKNMEGIYPCFFEDGGKQKQLIATQFESHHAREAFPCIDEPEAKATFQLTLTHASGETALGNTPVLKQTARDGKTTTVFEVTPVMSTYLVAFVVGELAYRETKSGRGVAIRTYATPHQIEHTDFALDIAAKCMDFYEDYYDIPFPLAKCDFVALPDFASGAMENWGLITFREQALLADKTSTSLSTRQWVALVVAHELTHQWFGNLVTMRWWTDLWLNEGFATWMEYLAVDTLFPEWNLWTQFAVDEQQAALRADALEHTHPIEVPVHHPDEIRTIFDMISYQKGGSVIHMLHDFLGADAFKAGLRHYLKTHAYKNTDTIDLWQALEDVTGQPVKKFMTTWTAEAGFPLLSVDEKDDHLIITQSRFVANPASPARQDTTLWPVPLLVDGELTRSTVEKRQTNIPFVDGKRPIKLNAGQTGFYRVDYSHELQVRQTAALDAGTLSDIDRMGLLADGFEITKAGYQSVGEYLDLLAHYRQEDSLATWEIIAGSLGSIRSTLSADDQTDELREAMKPFVRRLTKPQLERLDWQTRKDESHLDSLLRPLIAGLSAGADEPASVDTALKLYRTWAMGKPIDPDLRTIALATAARKGGKKEFDTMLAAYRKTHSSDEKLSITAAMTSFERPELHAAILDLMKTDTIRLQDVGYWLAYSFMNRHARAATWAWTKDNWQWLHANLGRDLSFARTPVYAARNFADRQLLEDYTAFFTAHMEPMLKRAFHQGLEMIETAVAWRERDAQVALTWFKAQSD